MIDIRKKMVSIKSTYNIDSSSFIVAMINLNGTIFLLLRLPCLIFKLSTISCIRNFKIQWMHELWFLSSGLDKAKFDMTLAFTLRFNCYRTERILSRTFFKTLFFAFFPFPGRATQRWSSQFDCCWHFSPSKDTATWETF